MFARIICAPFLSERGRTYSITFRAVLEIVSRVPGLPENILPSTKLRMRQWAQALGNMRQSRIYVEKQIGFKPSQLIFL